MAKLKINTLIGLTILIISIFGYINLQMGFNIETVKNIGAFPVESSLESNDLAVEITKNSSAIGPNSVIEFSINLTNTLSESLWDISANISDISEGLSLVPSTEPLFTLSSLDPDTSTSFQFITSFSGDATSKPVDLVLAIDASSSMGEEINTVKTALNDLITTLVTEIPHLRIGVIVFGWGAYDQYPTEDSNNYLPLTNDFDGVKAIINSLYAQGGIEPWGDALYLASTWDWREDAAKLIILVGDEDCDPGIFVGNELLESDPKGYYNGSDLLNIVTNLKDQGITISTVICGGVSTQMINQFEWVAAYTDGTSVYLPDLEIEGIGLPEIIEEWTLELGREYNLYLNLTVGWEDNMNTRYHTSYIENFWLDFSPPSVIISKTITPTGVDLFSVEFFITVDDISPIRSVTLYHDASGMLKSETLAPIENTSYFLFTLHDVQGGLNISYFVKSSDILKNSAFTSVYWVIVEPKFDEFGEEVSFWVESNKTIYTNIKIGSTGIYYFVLSGSTEISQIGVQLTARVTNTTVIPIQTQEINVSSSYSHKIFQFSLGSGDHAVTLSIPQSLGNSSSSYVWLKLKHPQTNRFTGSMTNAIRVYGIEWEATNGSYFSFDNQPGSPLVLKAEVYSSNWELVSSFIVGGSFQVSNNDTYYLLVWATLREGEFTIQLTEEEPDTTYDPYYTYEPTEYAADGANAPFYLEIILFLTIIGLIRINVKKKRKS